MGVLAFLAAVYSLYQGFMFDRQVTLALTRPKNDWTPRVCLIMPCKGTDRGLEANIEATLRQDYADFFVVVVTDTPEDEAYVIANSVLARHPNSNLEILVSDHNSGGSGKVSALLSAIRKTQSRAEVYAFVDSDSLIPTSWLGELVRPLLDESIGATTGFRWYFLSDGGFWSHVESAWNASGTNLMFYDRYNFPWGGAMAVRASTLDRIKINEVWAQAVSDDMALNSALRKEGRRILFLPQCTVATFNKTDLSNFLAWATRQTTLTRILNPSVWKYALAAYSFFDLVFLLGVLGLVLGVAFDLMWLIPSALLLAPAALGALRSFQRSSAFERAMQHMRNEFERNRVTDALASLFVPWIMTFCIISSAMTHEIEWRGRRYKVER